MLLTVGAGLVAGYINGLLGAGGGIILLWAMKHLNPARGDDAIRDNFASTVAAILLLSTVSAVTYSASFPIEAPTLALLVVPGIAGGIFGAYLTDKLNTSLLKLLFSLLIIIAGVNMVLR